MTEPLIVGIDPGNTTAVAALNLEGEIELLESRLEFSQDEVIQEIIETGHPVVVAGDKAEMPSSVEKIAASLGASRFSPEEDLSRARKEELGEGDNSHEKDAHAASLHAYKNLDKQVRKIRKRAEDESSRLELAREHFSDL